MLTIDLCNAHASSKDKGQQTADRDAWLQGLYCVCQIELCISTFKTMWPYYYYSILGLNLVYCTVVCFTVCV